MNPSRLFILRPVATSLLMIAIFLVGLLAYHLLPLSALPEVDYPTIQVSTLYPGASSDVVTSTITAPLERQFGQMPGLTRMSSSSSGGASVITLQFDLELGLDVAEQQVQAAINAGSHFLPTDLPSPPIYSKVNPADAPILSLALSSNVLPLTELEDLADTRMAQKISQLSGVGLVTVSGGQRPAVRVQVNPKALAAVGLTLEDLRTAVNNSSLSQSKGSFNGPATASTIDANDQLRSPEEFGNIILAWRNGTAMRIKDVAEVVQAAENSRLGAWANEHPAIVLDIRRQPGANVIAVANAIEQLLPTLQESLPASVEMTRLSDRTVTIRASVQDVQHELLFAIVLVVLVIFLFLRNVSATIIPAVAVPLSLVGTFAVMYLAGFSINNLTLMALTIATGFVVDDAVVMIENIARYIEKGEDAMSATLKGARQIGFTIISLTVSLIAVLIPLLFMQDVVGRLFREFAVTLALSILISAVVSLTLTPMMCARLLRHTPEEQHGRFSRAMGGFLDRTTALYGRTLAWVLQHQTLTLWTLIGTTALTAALYIVVPKGFFPIQDTGIIQGITEAPQSVSFHDMTKRQQALVQRILQDKAVASVSSLVGIDGVNTTLNSGRLTINLVPKAERDLTATDVMQRIQTQLNGFTDLKLYMQPVQDLTIESTISKNQYQFALMDVDSSTLAKSTQALLEQLNHSKHLQDVSSDLQTEGLQAWVQIDRDKASRLGLSAASIDTALYNAFGQRLISSIFTQSNQYRVVLEVHPRYGQDLSSLNNLYVSTSTKDAEGLPVQIPLSAIATIEQRKAPLVIHHLGQFPAANVSFNLAPGASLSQAVADIEQAKIISQMPASTELVYQGATTAFQSSLNNQLWLILAAIVTMYIVLGVLYESLIHPVTILSTLPSAGLGALLALLLTGNDLGIVGIIGIILLIGIVKKNAIMMIDFALQAQREHHLPAQEAIAQACLLRLRPILMTTLAALLAALPLMLGTGVGSELRQPLGLTMVGGLIVSQLLTLYTTPVLYLAFERLKARWQA